MATRIDSADAGLPLQPAGQVLRPVEWFMRLSIAPGLLLLACAGVALAWANSPWAGTYHEVFYGMSLVAGTDAAELNKPFILWINDGLMAIFFLLVGLEIKREILVGELSTRESAALPIAAAVGGMLVPAAIYALLMRGDPAIRGWGIPMATDIAFAMGALALLGSRVPASLRVFLVSLAVVDDLGALMVIALFYTEELKWGPMGAAGGCVLALGLLNAAGVRLLSPYLLLGVVLWYFVLKSGVHATLAGVVLAMTIPASSRVNLPRFISSSRVLLDRIDAWSKAPEAERAGPMTRDAIFTVSQNCQLTMPPLHRLEYALHDWVLFLVMPIFLALANAGVPLTGGDVETGASAAAAGGSGSSVALAIGAGLVVGKPIGVFVFSFLAVRLGLARLPEGVGWLHVVGVGLLAGIGFTMALFIASLALGDAAELEPAKLGILASSAIAGVAGIVTLLLAPGPKQADGAGAGAS